MALDGTKLSWWVDGEWSLVKMEMMGVGEVPLFTGSMAVMRFVSVFFYGTKTGDIYIDRY